MKSWTMLLPLIGGALAARSAYADQCQWVDPPEAARAVSLIERHKTIVEFCEPCGDKAPGVPKQVATAVDRAADAGLREVTADGQAIDLAYTYVKTSAHRYENLAALAGCEATGVSRHLRIEDATRDGVLIVADSAPTNTAAPDRAPVQVPAAPPPPTVIVVTPPPHSLGWWPAAAGAAGASAIWLAWVLAATRRRRAMDPRAVRLVDKS